MIRLSTTPPRLPACLIGWARAKLGPLFVRFALGLVLGPLCQPSLTLADTSGRATHLGSYSWTIDKPWFGGWSGIELSADGQSMTAITDRGRLLSGDIIRDEGQITGISIKRNTRIRSSKGEVLTPSIRDSEGLALAPDGRIYISFEGITRVAHYRAPKARAGVLRQHPDFRGFPVNNSLEALAIGPQGRVFAFPELTINGDRIQAFMWQDNRWTTPFTLEGGHGFLPVGADFGPDGRLYLLERAWNALGFRARVRRWDLTDDTPRNETLLVKTPLGTHGNLEGLSIWQDQQGRTRLTMIADDNFNAIQRSEIVEYVVQD